MVPLKNELNENLAVRIQAKIQMRFSTTENRENRKSAQNRIALNVYYVFQNVLIVRLKLGILYYTTINHKAR